MFVGLPDETLLDCNDRSESKKNLRIANARHHQVPGIVFIGDFSSFRVILREMGSGRKIKSVRLLTGRLPNLHHVDAALHLRDQTTVTGRRNGQRVDRLLTTPLILARTNMRPGDV
ncbi:MAG: hypothetical protein ABWY00_14780 [Dongiaceae bacterium]